MTSATQRWARRLGLVFMISGTLALVWGVIVWRWEDPFTAIYTAYEQHELSQAYDQRVHAFQSQLVPPHVTVHVPDRAHTVVVTHVNVKTEEAAVSKAALRYRLAS